MPVLDSAVKGQIKVPNFRWWICGLLFFATTINYVDRSVLGVLKGQLTKELGWNEIDYSHIVMWFQAAYAAGYLLSGRLMDLIGLKRGYTLSVGLWSLAAACTGFVSSIFAFCAVRAGLGLAEGGNFPAAVKTVGEWFPQRERALATGLFNAGSNVGPIVTPLVVAWLTLHFGWQSAFFVTGIVGFAWIVAWWLVYQKPSEHSRLSPEELEYIQCSPSIQAERIPWMSHLNRRSTWAFIVGMLFSAPIWWFYLNWGPDFFSKRFGYDLKNVGIPLVVIYLLADVGSIGGGWLSSHLIRNGKSVDFARKITLLVCVLCILPVVFAATVTQAWLAILLLGLAMAGHQGWSANLYTLVSDTTPQKAVSSVVGMGGMAGSLAGLFFSMYVGQVLQKTQSYTSILYIAPVAYVVALVLIQVLVPKIKPLTTPV